MPSSSITVQWFLCLVTLLAFVAAAYYAIVSRRQLVTMNDTLKEAHIQNVAQQRAMLTVSEPLGLVPIAIL